MTTLALRTALALAALALAACATAPAGPVDVPEFAEPVEVGPGDEVRGPEALERVAPVYPPELRDAGVEGSVVVKAVVGHDGRLRDAAVVRADHPALAAAVLAVLPEWRFRPATVNGEPVAVYYTLTQAFTLSR